MHRAFISCIAIQVRKDHQPGTNAHLFQINSKTAHMTRLIVHAVLLRSVLNGGSNVSIFAQPFIKRFALCYETDETVSVSVTLVYCGQTVGWIKIKLGT